MKILRVRRVYLKFHVEGLKSQKKLFCGRNTSKIKTNFGSNADFHMSQMKWMINDNQRVVALMYESASISVFFQHCSLSRWMKMMKILVCRVWTQQSIAAFIVNFHCSTNAYFQKKITKFQVGKLESLLCIVWLA